MDSRRPDIRHLLLNCPNTDTELPYIDLVNELLADKISPPIDAISTSYTQEALIDGTTYYYIVTAVNAVGQGAPSSQVSAAPAAPAAAPAAPGGVTATPGDTQVTHRLECGPRATSYNIYWSTSPGVTTANGTEITGAASPYIQTALVNGTTYYYIVTAVNAVGESAAVVPGFGGTSRTGRRAGRARRASPPPRVTPRSPCPGTPVPGATSYNIYWSTSPGVTTTNGTEITGAANPCVQTALINGTTYYYIVTAVNAVGESAPSAQVSAAPRADDRSASAGGRHRHARRCPDHHRLERGAGRNQLQHLLVHDAGGDHGQRDRDNRSWNPIWKQTSANTTAAELSAAPEYFNQGAYATLFGASYPFTLPYSAGLDELRTYLQQLNLPLWQLRQALLPLAGATVAQQAAVAAERFGMTPHGEDLVANANFVPAPVAWNTANPPTDVAPVPAFLQAASLSYESLLELLQVTWVQGGAERCDPGDRRHVHDQ